MTASEKSLAQSYQWGFFLTNFLMHGIILFYFHQRNFDNSKLLILVGIIAVWFIIVVYSKQYVWKLNKSLLSISYNFTKSYFILLILAVTFFYLFDFPMDFRDVLIAVLLGFLIMGTTTNFFIDLLINFIHKKLVSKKYTIVAGAGNQIRTMESLLDTNSNYAKRHVIRGFIKSEKEVPVAGENKIIGSVNEIESYLQENQIDEIIITLPLKASKKTKKILNLADYHGIRVKYLVDFDGTFGRSCKITKHGKFDALNIRQYPLDKKISAFLKSAFDFVFALTVLLLLFPVFLIVGILIKIDSPGTIFYCPTRIGKGGKPLTIYKFRTMTRNDSQVEGILSTQKDDPRISKLGKILRKYSIDELPQFINVFLGDMSVVGPRPHRSTLNRQFQECEENYMIRHYLKPGITGWAQVKGWRGPTETQEQKHQRTLHDLWYLENWTFSLDIKIIYLTIFGKQTHKNVF